MVTVKHYCIYFYVSNALTHSVYEIANGVFICVNNIHNPFVNPNLINILRNGNDVCNILQKITEVQTLGFFLHKLSKIKIQVIFQYFIYHLICKINNEMPLPRKQ